MARFAGPTCGIQTLVAKTCARCFQFKDASGFIKSKRGYYTSYCKVCFSADTGRLGRIGNEKTLESATNHYAVWTPQEIALVQRLVNRRFTYNEIAQRLGRSNYAIMNLKAKHHIRPQRVFLAKPGAKLDTTYLHNYFQEMAA